MVFHSYDMVPMLFSDVDDVDWERDSWLHFTEDEPTPGVIRL
ncbi:hypothetical protein ACW9UR_05510 [Halovulum sp. GXIMD14794]